VNTTLRINRRIVLIISSLLLLIGVGVAVYLIGQQQDVRQRAAGGADLIVESLQLVDAGGNTRTTFYAGEDIFVRVKLKNQGDASGQSSDGFTYTEIYDNNASVVAPNTPSDVNVSLKNGEFGTGFSKEYQSTIGGPNRGNFNDKFSWRRNTPGTFTARAFINYNHNVQETNYDNNQLAVQYTVVAVPKNGKVTKSQPSGYANWPECTEPTTTLVPGLRGCVGEAPFNGKSVGQVRNIGSTTQTVGMAIYRVYQDYPNPYPSCEASECPDQFNWIWTQTYFDGATISLAPGETAYFELPTPDCQWQADVFKGEIIPSFSPPNRSYSGQQLYLDGHMYLTPDLCDSVQLSPTPTLPPSVTPSPTLLPSPTPTLPPGVTPSVTPSLTPSATPSPTISPSACPTPARVQNVRIVCPNCSN
jgi:hypothetical protein